ncbi:hypothetical protein C2845_PM07G11600 [Panicum miliaceum]|uniref:Uncharacterized protein n=1 Tax=Panicum miliaceum TaxID=4540 RepID=A0A3L6SIN5_PANMI|nr:hypothetical protein C2845_PM07G11600 [Panicum miliaceum]
MKQQEALSNIQWIHDTTLCPNISTHHLQQFIDLWVIVREVRLNPEVATQSAIGGITQSVKEWWHMMGNLWGVPPRALKSLLLLVNNSPKKNQGGGVSVGNCGTSTPGGSHQSLVVGCRPSFV